MRKKFEIVTSGTVTVNPSWTSIRGLFLGHVIFTLGLVRLVINKQKQVQAIKAIAVL
ncbi:hypothetical protein J2Z83_003504 [Virgibacillus natechei]|uniref:Uncharacterized protein n=1 Tax=Virgibacillus natechei TaxID=1216297 RepID=A0ABS4IK78_9BACI|nr:hypothetical protein [Virgibacillus natechei]